MWITGFGGMFHVFTCLDLFILQSWILNWIQDCFWYAYWRVYHNGLILMMRELIKTFQDFIDKFPWNRRDFCFQKAAFRDFQKFSDFWRLLWWPLQQWHHSTVTKEIHLEIADRSCGFIKQANWEQADEMNQSLPLLWQQTNPNSFNVNLQCKSFLFYYFFHSTTFRFAYISAHLSSFLRLRQTQHRIKINIPRQMGGLSIEIETMMIFLFSGAFHQKEVHEEEILSASCHLTKRKRA